MANTLTKPRALILSKRAASAAEEEEEEKEEEDTLRKVHLRRAS
jgi:hypothetical protein